MKIGIAALDSVLGAGGGVDVYTRLLIESLADYEPGNHYYVLFENSIGNSWDYRNWPPNIHFVPLYSVEPRQPLFVRARRRLWRSLGLPVQAHYGDAYLAHQIDSLNLDVIHYPRHVIQPLSLKTPCVITFFDLQHEYYPQFFTKQELDWRAVWYRPSVDKAKHVIATSEYTRRTLCEKYATAEEQVIVIPVGLSETFGRASDSGVARMRSKYSLPKEFIYYPANPWPHKNHSRLVAALRIYQDCYGEPPVLVLSGRLHNERRDAKELAIAAGVQNRIIDLGYLPRDEWAAVYTAATAMVFPSFFEGFGMPLLEAMACGCPIAAANSTSIPEVVNDAALLFDPFDPSAIAHSIYQMLSDEELRAELVEHGYRQLERYAWKDIVPRIVRVYEQVAGR